MLQTLVSNLCGGYEEELVGNSEIQGTAESSIDAFCLADIVVGPSRLHIRTSMLEIMPIVKEHMQKIYNSASSIALIRDTTVVGRKTLFDS